MKKFLTLLMLVAPIAFFAGCNGGTGTDPTTDVSVTNPPVTATQPPQPGETQPPDQGGGTLRPEGVLYRPFGDRATVLEYIASRGDDFAPSGQIVIGSSTQATANILHGWDNMATNAWARDLMFFNNLGTMESNMNREMFENPMVNSAPIQIRDNPDGSRTYHFTIYTDNRFSDGTFITAEHYAGNIAFVIHPYVAAVKATPRSTFEVVGRDEYLAGETDVLTGVRLYNDSEFSVTIGPDWLPFLWEAQSYMNWSPMPLHAMLPGVTVHDDGEGVFFRGMSPEVVTIGINGGDPILDEDTGEILGGTGFRFAPTVSVGPYRFVSFDTSSFQMHLEVNPYFVGTWDGFMPRIQNVFISHVPNAMLTDALVLGEIDLVVGQGGGSVINAMFDQAVGGGTHQFIPYTRNGYGFIRFHVDHGPTYFTPVRQAIKWLIDREEFAYLFTLGHGVVNHGPYGTAQWWVQEAYNTRNLGDRLIMYTYNPTEAIRLLEADGWVLNADGTPFVLGSAANPGVRYKDVNDYPHLIEIDREHGLGLVNDLGLMRLEINWATFTANPITDVIDILVPHEMRAVGMEITDQRFDNALAWIGRTAADPGPRFHMFNQGVTFNPLVVFFWDNHDPSLLGGGINNNFSTDPELFELANRLRFIDATTEAGQNEFVDAWVEYIIMMNYLVFDIPLYVDIWYDFFNNRIGDWENNSVWGFPPAVTRAYVN